MHKTKQLTFILSLTTNLILQQNLILPKVRRGLITFGKKMHNSVFLNSWKVSMVFSEAP